MDKKKIFLIAGEVSGDLHGSLLVRELKKLDHSFEFYGLGGQAMASEGVRIFFDLPSIAALGLGDVLRKYLPFRKVFYKTLDHVLNNLKPDLIVLIDYPGFNIRFAKKIAKKIPIVYYISPQVWAWGRRRVKTIARVVDLMLVLFPFEIEVYRGTGLPCRFVGHPLIDLVKPSKSKAELIKEWNLGNHRLLSLLPGSREQEIKRILPVMLKSAEILKARFPDLRFILTQTASLPPSLYKTILSQSTLSPLCIINRMYDALAISDFALVASGTATLETSISLTPFVILYKTAWSTYLLGRRLIQIPYIGLTNVLSGKKVIPEFIQQDADPEKIAEIVAEYLDKPDLRQGMVDSLKKVCASLGPSGAPERAAKAILEFMRPEKAPDLKTQFSEPSQQGLAS